ncbi:glycosyltransferase family 2 protein [Winogradskyella alexanderae]|uniref:Glycosyltransferase family 2 protein n=1 Tax=Winogradskyella alexanderae TaxID=2877123 RepID=A0ABS7XT47_9FLAO|nr:glycosyltransferase family 2 protein [Winogradskyella alexanderae]MCA0132097.1 glycosyltransferase family 2 protein [Winogradskyella alexanderae]
MKSFEASLIISTYNQPKWLEKVLWSCENQTEANFEVIIADDGSKDDTKKLIDTFQKTSKLLIKHVWHEDRGFQKTIILNKAIVASNTDYLIFTDGDCVLRNDFIATHLNNREKGYFLSGGYFKLPMHISELITRQVILDQKCFNIKWLKEKGLKSSFKNNKLSSKGLKTKLLNALTPTKATWNGHNASGWKADIIEANGFDERMQYGGEDRELGERLFNKDIKAKQLRYSAVCVHLYHERGYVTPEMIEKNLKIRAHTKKSKITTTPFGIEKLS